MNFKTVLQWIKQNPIAVASVVLCLASLIFLMIVNAKGNSFMEEARTRSQEIKRIEGFSSTPMRLPPERVDAPPRVVNAAVNQAAIDYLQSVFGQMQGDYNKIWDLAVKHNRGDVTRGLHIPMLEGLFPDSSGRAYKLYDARDPYESAFEDMLLPASGNTAYPRLNAGRPASQELLDQATESIERNMRIRLNIPPNQQLSPAQQNQLMLDKRQAMMDVLRQQAQRIHIYANRNAFQIDQWEVPPQMTTLWESQMNLWIQQDIVQTIARTNRVSNPSQSVISAPIKRLNSIKVVPGYVGINTGGGIVGGGGRGQEQIASGETKLPDDFSYAPTGRMSNTLYDVKHVWVDMDVDIQQLPVFMDELVQTNFMSVLKMEMSNVDEYAMLSQGYFYGTGDVVNVRILIETIWLRDWLVPMMPPAIKQMLGVTSANESTAMAR